MTDNPISPNELATVDTQSRQIQTMPTQDVPIGAILAAAVERGMDPASLEKLFALYERDKASKAAAAFKAAFAAFKAECPPIPRRTENTQFFVTRNGVKVPRKYASLEDIGTTIKGTLGKHGLSYGWGDAVVNGGEVTVACIVSHEAGHSISASATYPIDSKAGCSDQQKRMTAATYAMRDGLRRALGLHDVEDDDDGNVRPQAPVATITDEQAANLAALMDEVNQDAKKFRAFYGINAIKELPAAQFVQAVRVLEKKRGGNK